MSCWRKRPRCSRSSPGACTRCRLPVPLEEDSAASRVLAALDIDEIDRILSDFRRVAEAFQTSATAEWTVVLKGVQVVTSLQKVLAAEDLQQLLDVSLVDRAQRRMQDFLSVVRGLHSSKPKNRVPSTG